MSIHSRSVCAALAAIILIAGSVQAADMVMNHEPGPYKMTKFGRSGETIPLNGPVIHVFSKDGKQYDAIANDNQNLKHVSQVGGICGRRSQSIGSASLEVGGVTHTVGGTGGNVMQRHTESFAFPFAVPDMARKPAAACNFELDKRVAQGNKTREYWLERGFVVRYENAYEATFTASCAGGVSRGDFGVEKIRTPVWIACAATEPGSQPKANTPARQPKSRARPPLPLKVSAKLEATQRGTIHASECPVTVRYTGSIWVSRPDTTVRYQIVGADWQSPERQLTIDKTGSIEITGWTQYFREQPRDPNALAASTPGAGEPDAKGSARLEVRYEGGTVRSEAIPYKVFCNSAPPKRSRLRKE